MNTSPLALWQKAMKKHFEEGVDQLAFNESELITALMQELETTAALDNVASKRAAMLRQSLKGKPSDLTRKSTEDRKEEK